MGGRFSAATVIRDARLAPNASRSGRGVGNARILGWRSTWWEGWSGRGVRWRGAVL